MHKILFQFVMLVILAGSLAGAAAAAAISFSPSTITLQPGATQQVTVKLSDASNGLAGYECVLAYPSSTVTVSASTFPSWASSMNRGSAISGGYVISAVDLGKQVQDGATDITLATITLKGVSTGTGTVSIKSVQMNADNGVVMSPDTGTLSVSVSGDAATVSTTTASATETTLATATATTAAAATTTTAATTVTTTATTAAVTPAETTAAVVTVTPVVPGAPVTGFTADPVVGFAPLKVQFFDRSAGSPTSFEWDFGDGGSAMIENPVYTYQTAGTYTVTLTATNDKGSTKNTRAAFITVVKPGETLPVPSTPALAETQAAGTTESRPAATSSWKPAVTKTGKSAPDPAVTLLVAGIALSGIALLQRRKSP